MESESANGETLKTRAVLDFPFAFILRSGRRRNDKKNYVFELEIRKKKVWKTSLGDDGCA